MSIKVSFLGTGGDSVVVAKQMLSSGGFVVEVGDTQLHIDPGPGALVRAAQYGVNIRNTTALLVSHNHLNHCNDVNAIINGMTYGGMDKKGVVIGNKTLYEGADKIDPYLTGFHKSCVERCLMIEPGKRMGVEDIEVLGLKADHMDPNTCAFKLVTPGFVLGYSSDTQMFDGIADQFKDVDMLVLNVVNPAGEHSEGLLNSDDAIKIITDAKPRLAVLQHFGIKMLKADPLAEARRIQRESRVEAVAAKTGMILNPVP